MALIAGPLSSDRAMSESEWTRLLLKYGYAELAPSERLKPPGKSLARREALPPSSQTPPEPSSEGLYARTRGEPRRAVSQTRTVSDPERRRSLEDTAERFTAKRRYRRSK